MTVVTDKPPERAKASPPLAYERGGGPYASRRGFRLLLALTLLNTLMLAAFVVGPQIKPFAQEQWQQWQAARAAQKQLQADVAVRQACIDYAPPGGLVAYEEDPDEAAKLLAPGDGKYAPLSGVGGLPRTEARRRRANGERIVPFEFKPPALAVPPEALKAFDFRVSGGGGGQGLFGSPASDDPALLFLHERTTPRGTKYLVAVRLYPGYDIGWTESTTDKVTGSTTDRVHSQIWTLVKNRRLVASAWDYPAPPASPQLASQWNLLLALPDRNRTRAEVPVPVKPVDASAGLIGEGDKDDPPLRVDPGNRLRVYAGQADLADPSHFTIAYVLDGKAGTIDGWAKDAGVVLRPREGAAVAPDPASATKFDENWDLTAPAATQPGGERARP